ncbi:hypothetical protein [Ferrimicrobium sp.]|uniref:hypothetical protein n=1 Tax=Ferrimicrobium sp. TaxID=2926050 RepID=UPI00260E712B|nr:hypothetical protein [Ferrimicrobium sp.]
MVHRIEHGSVSDHYEVSVVNGKIIEARIRQGRSLFVQLVLPSIAYHLGDGLLFDVEDRHEETLQMLDRAAKIDYYFRPDGLGAAFGISARVTQQGYRTLTVSAHQLAALKNIFGLQGAARPAVFVHGAMDREGQLLATAIVGVTSFLDWISTHPGKSHINHSNDQMFFSWEFDDLVGDAGCPGALVVPGRQFSWGQRSSATFARSPQLVSL